MEGCHFSMNKYMAQTHYQIFVNSEFHKMNFNPIPYRHEKIIVLLKCIRKKFTSLNVINIHFAQETYLPTRFLYVLQEISKIPVESNQLEHDKLAFSYANFLF